MGNKAGTSLLPITATVNMHNSKVVDSCKCTFVPNHVEISLSRKNVDFLCNRIESDQAIHPLGNFTTNSDLSKRTLPTNVHALKRKSVDTSDKINSAKIAKLDKKDYPINGFVHSKICEESCPQSCAKSYGDSTDIQDEITHWSILSPSPVYP